MLRTSIIQSDLEGNDFTSAEIRGGALGKFNFFSYG